MTAILPRVAIITGGAGGLGLAIARRFLADGYQLAIADLGDEASIRSELELHLGDLSDTKVFQCDVSSLTSVQHLFERVVESHGRIDTLVNSAGIGPLKPLLDMAPEMWQQTLAVNLTGTFFCAQAAARVMTRQRSGRIVNIASVSGMRAGFARAAYGVSKAGVIQLTRQLAVELAPFGITVNAVGPGPVDTALAIEHHTPSMRADYYRTIPAGRYGTPEEVAHAVSFLCGEGADYVNGQTLFVDGGFTAGGVDIASAQAMAKPNDPE